MTRTGEYAPPSALPAETVTIFTDGGADYDPKAKAWVAAGFGLVAVEDGDGEEGGRCAFEECGPIHAGQEGGENLTNNTAEMIGFIHALRYAREPERASRPVLVTSSGHVVRCDTSNKSAGTEGGGAVAVSAGFGVSLVVRPT